MYLVINIVHHYIPKDNIDFILMPADSIICLMIPDVILAPLSGITDLAYRLICRELGAKFCLYEMLDSNSLVYKRPRTMRMLETHKKDKPIAAQLVGSDPSIMLEAASKLIEMREISFIDLNAACPAPKITRKKGGAYLLEDTITLGRIIKRLSSGLKIPVTVKLRSGFNSIDHNKLIKIAKICRDSGASLIFLHGRSMVQGYAGEVDYEAIRLVKSSLDIPVYGSGNILSPSLARKMLDRTGCDGVLVARGSLGNPWIFSDIDASLRGKTSYVERGLGPKKRVLKKHLSYIHKYKKASSANKNGIMGKTAMWYLKGIPDATRLRDKINRIKSYRGLLSIIEQA